MKKKLPSKNEGISLPAWIIAFTICATSLSNSVYGQLELLKDINTSEEQSYNEYAQLTHGIGRMYYVSENELWKSNGTPESTIRLRAFKSISNLTMVGTTLYFSADDGLGGVELWKSNGTPGSTIRVKDIMPGGSGSNPANLTVVNDVLYFSAYTVAHGIELWKSDGTNVGTALVKDIISGNSNPRAMTGVNGILYFCATNGINGYELWRSDGTAGGTTLLKDIVVGKSSSDPQMLTNFNSKLYFTAYDPAYGRELWISDGTSDGTTRLKDVRPGTQSSTPKNMVVVKDKLMFTAHDGKHGEELWKTDGTLTGTVMVKDMNPGGAGSNSTRVGHSMRGFANMNGYLFFIAAQGTEEFIYRSDGTESGTMILRSAIGAGSGPLQPAFTYMNGYVYFFCGTYNGSSEQALLRMPYRGTKAEISFVRYFDAPFSWFEPYPVTRNEMIHFYNNLYFFGRFSGYDDIYEGYEFIRCNGTYEGTTSVYDNFAPTQDAEPREMIRAGNIVYMNIYGPLSYTPPMWRTDGTPEGTFELMSEQYWLDWVAVGDQLYVLIDDENGYDGHWRLLRTDGTNVAYVDSRGTTDSETLPWGFSGVGNTLYYTNDLGELWKTEGTPESTILVRDFDGVNLLTNVNGILYFFARTGTDTGLWKMSGATPTLVYNFAATGAGGNFVSDGSIGYFITGGAGGRQVWRTDGTSAGTYRFDVPNRNDGTEEWNRSVYSRLIIYNHKVYVVGESTYGGQALFRVDGAEGFEKLGDLGNYYSSYLVNDKLVLFTVGDLSLDAYAYNDVTESLVHIATVNAEYYVDPAITKVGNYIYFNTRFSKHLYRTDGSFCGTYKVDIGATDVFSLSSIGDDLIFGGYTLKTGVEPHVYHNINSLTGTPACEDEPVALSQTAFSAPSSSSEQLTYPNPFNSSFKLNFKCDVDERVDVSVFTLYGAPVETLSGLMTNTEYQVGDSWPVGTYILKVKTSRTTFTEQVIKK